MQELEDFGWKKKKLIFSFDANFMKMNPHDQTHPIGK